MATSLSETSNLLLDEDKQTPIVTTEGDKLDDCLALEILISHPVTYWGQSGGGGKVEKSSRRLCDNAQNRLIFHPRILGSKGFLVVPGSTNKYILVNCSV